MVLTCVGNLYKMAKGAKIAQKCITVADRLKVISEQNKGTAVKEVAKLFGISKTQVNYMYIDKPTYRDAVEKSLSAFENIAEQSKAS